MDELTRVLRFFDLNFFWREMAPEGGRTDGVYYPKKST
jgi:hypothetical protein